MRVRAIMVCLFASGTLARAAELPPFSLNDDALPRKYSLDLTLDPERGAFEGIARIEVDLARRMPVIWLNGSGLEISEATAEMKGRVVPAQATAAGEDLLAVEPETPAGPGRVALTLKYRAPLAAKAVIGPYRVQYEDRWYIFTTFTPTGARSAFPCFDQPRFKTPWDVRLHVKREYRAFSNAAMVSETDEPGGMKAVAFATTEPLPSEVVAFAAGPFDIFEGAPAGRREIPIRVIAPKGHAAQGEEAARATPEMLFRLESYTGMPYPYDKLDQVALPELPFGAVENPGFITYRLRSLLFSPGGAGATQTRAVRAVEAHEMAHQWFGDMVTQANWEDVWLSEGFATWLSAKVMDQDQPAARQHLAAAVARERIMEADEGARTRPVRVVMRDREMMKNVYSPFVYQKGAAVLTMLEGWLGENAVRGGLRLYLADHRFASATTGDLVAALRLASGIDPAESMHDFLDQTGVPAIHAEVRCEPGLDPRLEFEQTNAARHWDVPVCWKTPAASSCLIVDTRRQVPLPRNAPCPAWVYANANASGYYRIQWDAAQLAAMDDAALKNLTAPERLALANDVNALRRSGRLDAAAVNPVLTRLAADPEPEIAQAAAKGLEQKQ